MFRKAAIISGFFVLLYGMTCKHSDQGALIFSVMGDVPRSAFEDSLIQKQIEGHNRYSPSEFMLHVGDIKHGSTPCDKAVYLKVSGSLKLLSVPTF